MELNIKKIIKELDLLFPNPKTELNYNNDFQLLVAIIMSARNKDIQVNKVNEVFFTKFKTPKDLYMMGEKKILKNIKAIGLNNSKSRNIFLTSKMLYKDYNEVIPDDLEEIQKLPGVGVKTAKVWLSIVKNKPYLGVDTHVHRVLNRLGIIKTKTPLETDKDAHKKLKKEDLARLHHTLILFGRYYCTSQKPKCKNCKLFDLCKYENKNI